MGWRALTQAGVPSYPPQYSPLSSTLPTSTHLSERGSLFLDNLNTPTPYFQVGQKQESGFST